MSGSAKLFASFFALLALAALGNDIYVWYNANGFPFAFAALGWITKTYIPDEHQMVVDMLGAETFNSILTPVLQIPAFFLASGMAVFVVAVDFLNRKVGKIGGEKEKAPVRKFDRKR